MENYTKVFIPLIIAVILSSMTYVFSQTNDTKDFEKRPPRGEGFRPPPPHGKHGAGLPPHVLDELNLTDAQKQQIETLRSTSRDIGKEYFEKVRQADEQLKTLVESGSFNEVQARQILTEKASAMTELELIRLQTDAAIFNVFTSEQKAQIETLKSQRPPRPERREF